MKISRQTKIERTRRFRYAAGYVIEQEGTDIVERLVRDGTFSKFGVREDQALDTSLESLTRTDAEKILRKKGWEFQNYEKIEALTVPTKIFDTQILFDPETAITRAQQVLEIEETARLDRKTRRAIEDVEEREFFPDYIERLRLFVEGNYNSRQAIIKRVRNRPYRNVQASSTTL